MSRDARQSLTALVSVVLLIAFFVLSLNFLGRVELPAWTTALAAVLGGVSLIWDIILLYRRGHVEQSGLNG